MVTGTGVVPIEETYEQTGTDFVPIEETVW